MKIRNAIRNDNENLKLFGVNNFKDFYSEENSYSYIAEFDGTIVGYAYGYGYTDPIYNIAVLNICGIKIDGHDNKKLFLDYVVKYALEEDLFNKVVFMAPKNNDYVNGEAKDLSVYEWT